MSEPVCLDTAIEDMIAALPAANQAVIRGRHLAEPDAACPYRDGYAEKLTGDSIRRIRRLLRDD